MSLLRVATYQLLLAAGLAVTPITAQNLRELAREQAHRNLGRPIEQPSSPGDYSPKTIEDLTRESEVVLQGTLSKVKSYLSSNEDRILTDYLISNPRVITGSLPVQSTPNPGAVAPLNLTTFGGEIVIDGVVVRGTDSDRTAIMDGRKYLLFLRRSRQGGMGRYEIYHGGIFDISDGKVTPLLRQAKDVFQGTVDAPLDQLIQRVQRAAQRR